LTYTTTRASEVPVHERLARDAIDIKKEAVKRHLEKFAQEMEGLTFKPNLPVSTYICVYVHA
jgi:hypothetical protein